MQAHGVFLAHPRLSLVLRPWVQDIEGANARALCNTSSAKLRVSVPTGEVPFEGRREAGAQVALQAPAFRCWRV